MFELSSISKEFVVRGARLFRGGDRLRALHGVDLRVRPGETLAVVGESGCGKSTLGRILLRLLRPTAGTVRYRGRDLWTLSRQETKAYRREVQMIFQDPYASLDPRMRAVDIVAEPLDVHGLAPGAARLRTVEGLLEAVGLPPEAGSRFPHQWSGGQRQRLGIARALAAGPRVIVADEPVSALDVSVQAQILNLLLELKRERGLTFVFISHDLRVVRHLCDRVAVFYLGQPVEIGPVADVYRDPLHPYTEALLSSVPVPDPGTPAAPRALAGEVPSPIRPPGGCPFHPRCSRALEVCARLPPPDLERAGRRVACHLYGR